MNHELEWPASDSALALYDRSAMPVPPTWQRDLSGKPPYLRDGRARQRALEYGYDEKCMGAAWCHSSSGARPTQTGVSSSSTKHRPHSSQLGSWPLYAVRTQRWMYVQTFDIKDRDSLVFEELYDLKNDPHETRNLVDEESY
jgi:hypothetical protein